MIAQLLKQSAWYVFAVTLQRGLPLVLLPLVAADLGSEAIGLVALGALVAGAVMLVSTFGLNISSVRFGAQTDRKASPEARSGLFAVQFGWSIAVGVAAIVATWIWWPWPMTGDGRTVAVAAVLLGVSQSWLQMAMSTFRAYQQPKKYLSVAAAVFAVSVPAVLILVPPFGATGYLAGLALGAMAPAVVAIILTLSKPVFDRVFLRSALVLATPFLVHWIATWVLVGFDRFLIDSSLGLEATGVYYVAFVYGSVPLLIAEAFGTAWVPRFLTSEASAALRGRLAVLVSLGMSALVLVGLAGAIVILPMLYENLDADVLPILGILAPLAVVRVPHVVGSAPLIQSDRTSVLGASSLTAALTNVVLVILVVSAGGLVGVASAKIVAYALASVWVWAAISGPDQRLRGAAIVVAGLSLSVGAYVILESASRSDTEYLALAVFSVLGVLAIAATKRYFGLHFEGGGVESVRTES